MTFPKIEMDDDLADAQATSEQRGNLEDQPHNLSDEMARLRDDFQSRLVIAGLRTEALRAGMVDLDGLKLIDHAGIRLGDQDQILGGRKLMDDLRRNKPWLFAVASSSSGATAPASQPARQRTALEMTDEEYVVAKAALTKHQF